MNPNEVTTGKARLSYANLFTPKAAKGSDKLKYSVSVLIPKSDKETLARINKAIAYAKEQGKSAKWGGKIPAKLVEPLHDGDIDREDDPVYKNSYYFNAKSDRPPIVIDRMKNEILDPLEVYSGCYGRVNVSFYAYNFEGNKGVAVGLNAVQKVADGEPLGVGSVDVDSAFGDIDEDGMFD